jgi:hypothetical protein
MRCAEENHEPELDLPATVDACHSAFSAYFVDHYILAQRFGQAV